jgi:TetR/AcrR family fatty acid metabolism transcriptional regulator
MLVNDRSFIMTAIEENDPPRAAKRERILRAAVEVFARTGYFNAKVSEVAREAGVADGTIYLYFQGKEDLLVTIFREHTHAFLADAKQAIEGVDDAAERIRRLVRHHLSVLGSDRSLAVVFQVELRHSLKFMSLFSKNEVAEYLELLRTVVDQGQTDGSFRSNVHPQLVAKSIFGMLDEMVTSWILSEKEYRLDDQSEALADLVLRGLAAF